MKEKLILAAATMVIILAGCGSKDTEIAPVAETIIDQADISVCAEEVEAEKEEEESYQVIETETDDEDEDFTTEVEEDMHYAEVLSDVTETIRRCKDVNFRDDAYLKVYHACEEYPEDEALLDLKQTLLDEAPDHVRDEMIVNKKSCKIEYEWITGVNGENLDTDFNINLGGGSLSLTLKERYTRLNLKAMLSNLSPTKANVDIDIYADGELIYSLEDFNTDQAIADIWLDVEGTDTLIIDSADHDHFWVGEASFSKPDSACHFSLALYEERDLVWID